MTQTVPRARREIPRAPGARTAGPAGLVGQRYRLGARLGSGAAGTVWLAEDEHLGRPVAVKEVRRARLADPLTARREARAAAGVTHPATIRVYDLVVDDDAGTDWLVTEFLPGRSLGQVLELDGHICPEEARYVARHLLSALDAVHARSLLHRDVKPSNIQLCDDGRVVLMDFGLAAAPGTLAGAPPGVIAGSLAYLAPEVLWEGRYSTASDLYALGVTLYAAVAGMLPVLLPADLLLELDAVPGGPPVPTPAARLAPLISGLLESDPRRRLTSGQAHRLLA